MAQSPHPDFESIGHTRLVFVSNNKFSYLHINNTNVSATAYPPIVVDLSTEFDTPWRHPPQWSTFPQFSERLGVEMKNLRHSHAFEVMFP